MKDRLGFTLVEVMMAMFIMSALAVLVSGTIRASVKNKQKLSNRIYVQSMLYDTLRIMKMDIEKAFNYKDFFYEIEKQAIEKLNSAKNKKTQGGVVQDEQGVLLPPQPPKLTHFLGEVDSLHFTSLNHFRTNYNAQESNQMEVGYFLENCISRSTKEQTRCLWRRAQVNVDDEVDEGGEKTVIAENVSNFKLSYRGDDFEVDREPEWVDQWRSDNKGRPDHRDKFPHQVMIELGIDDESQKGGTSIKEKIVVNIHFPNNQVILRPQPGSPGRPGQTEQSQRPPNAN